MGKNGWTDVEMGTGDLDSSELEPGYISKAQINVFDSLGDHVFTDNYNDLSSSYFSTQANYFRRGQPMQIHGNVKGVNGEGTEVVKVDITVKARPDLAMELLNHPGEAVIGTPVNIAATISERNGDVGARANCLLFVEGAEVDRALGIWVDSGDSVSCVFSYTFTSLGTKGLRVKIADVAPADWDEENNSGTSSIVVVNPDYDWASVAAGYSEYGSTVTTSGSYHGRTSGYDYVNTSTSSGWSQWANYRAYLFQALQFPVQVSAYMTEGTGRFDRRSPTLRRPELSGILALNGPTDGPYHNARNLPATSTRVVFDAPVPVAAL